MFFLHIIVATEHTDPTVYHTPLTSPGEPSYEPPKLGRREFWTKKTPKINFRAQNGTFFGVDPRHFTVPLGYCIAHVHLKYEPNQPKNAREMAKKPQKMAPKT